MTREVVVAVDVGGTQMKCALVGRGGVLRHRERHPTAGRADLVGAILDVARGLAERARAEGCVPTAAGVVVPGVVDEARGVAVKAANLPLREVPLRDLLTDHLDLPAALGHDVRAGALAEARLGAGRHADNVLLDPDLVVVGGGLSRAGAALLDPLRAALRQRLPFLREPWVVAAALGDEAGCLGAGLLAEGAR
ncbi:hypothetical protein GCM10023170_024480 [Phytohabitans houttuyneae]|uniref:ROK family protein n=1 Tax=Phytohabitans houttuyneae TaxID=1076126 RepID=A0A6V8KCM8_9ACTN|nr:ROK family protein [Phytohabitans houttuyneae]GFJ82992.1 hypothetical protein Phou_071720 [Phytohabitans houttuyneae]